MKKASFGILIKDKTVLLTKRMDIPVWVLPGGGIEEGETPDAACMREIREETGMDAKVVKATHVLQPVNFFTSETFLFLCSGQGELSFSSDESRENRFFPLNELPRDLFWVHKQWIDEALRMEPVIRRDLTEVSWFSIFSYFCQHPFQICRLLWTRITKS